MRSADIRAESPIQTADQIEAAVRTGRITEEEADAIVSDLIRGIFDH